MSNPFDIIGEVFTAVATGGLSLITALPSDAKSWLTSAGGAIGSGIEGGFIALFKDLWNVILPVAEIFVGAVFIIFAVAFLFKNDMIQAASVFGLAAI